MFKKFTLKPALENGEIQASEKFISISKMGEIERLIKVMSGMNKVISPAFIRDWCLKCCRYIKATCDQFKRPITKLTTAWFKRIDFHKSKVHARSILDTM